MEKLAKEATDPESIEASIKRIYESRSVAYRKPITKEDMPKPDGTKKGRVSKTFCQVDQIHIMT